MKKLLIYIIAYNTEKFITNVLDRISIDLTKKYDVEILINDDSSLDRTFKIIDSYTKENKDKFNFKILSNPKNQGYGGNQKIGYFYALKNNFDFVALLHGDGQYAPEYLDSLIEPLHQENIDAVFGSRIKNQEVYFHYKMNKYAVMLLSKLINILYGGSFTDVATNHKLIKREVLNKLNLISKGFTLDFEISLKLAKYKFKCEEVSIEYSPRTYDEGKKINLLDAIKSFFIVIYFLFRK